MKDNLWFFTSARYYSVNNFIANTVFDDGSQGIDDQYIKSAMARLTWQISPRNKLSGYFDEIDKYRGHDMQSNEDPETAALQWFSPAYNTGTIKCTSTVSSKMLLEAGYSRNLEYYTNSYQDGVGQPRFTAAWFAGASRLENDLGGRKTAATAENTQSPERHNAPGVAVVHHRRPQLQGRASSTRGATSCHTVDANGDLTQQYRSNCHRRAVLGPRQRHHPQHAALLRRTAEPRLRHLRAGLLEAESADGQRRAPVGEHQGAGAGQRIACRPVRAGAQLRRPSRTCPTGRTCAPRFSAVYDLFGNGKTALKYSLNRYNQIRTTGIAANYNPFQSLTSASLPWRDVNGNDIAEGERGCTGYPARRAARSTSAGFPPTSARRR